MEAAIEVARLGKRKTVQSRHASAACQLALVGELATHSRGATNRATVKLAQ